MLKKVYLSILAGVIASQAMSNRPKVELNKSAEDSDRMATPRVEVTKASNPRSQVINVSGSEELPPLIPMPNKLVMKSGTLKLFPNANVGFSKELDSTKVSQLLKSTLAKDTSSPLSSLNVRNISGSNPSIYLKAEASLKNEEYRLAVYDTIVISASSYSGWLYGLKSLEQILQRKKRINQQSDTKVYYVVPKLYIQDSPANYWRGAMIDVSRHFFPIGVLYKLVDRMSYYKLNRLHLHLSDDQGWRVEVKAYPNLTQVGAKSQVGGHPMLGKGYYTQDELKGLISYAKSHGIEVIPELDMPGHVYAALTAVPELNCQDGSNVFKGRWEPNPPKIPEPYIGTKVGFNKLCLTRKEPYEFFSEVMQEMVQVFEAPYIHLGGDEIEDKLYTHFVHFADSVIRSHGRTVIGWEEVLKAEVDKSTIAQIWLRESNENHRKEAIQNQSRVIMSPCENFYLDHANEEGQPRTMSWCTKDVTISDIYNYVQDTSLNVIGYEAPVWTEYVQTEADLDDRLWPRLIAVSERAWTHKENRSFAGFQVRMKDHTLDMNKMRIQFYKSPKKSF